MAYGIDAVFARLVLSAYEITLFNRVRGLVNWYCGRAYSLMDVVVSLNAGINKNLRLLVHGK